MPEHVTLVPPGKPPERRVPFRTGEMSTPYAAYRESSIPWLGSVPSHWRTKPLKYVAAINTDEIADATDPDYVIRYADIGNVSMLDGITATEEYRFEDAPSRARRCVRDGDTIISTVRTYLKAVARIELPPSNLVVSTGFAVLRPGQEIDAGFLYRVVQSEGFVGCVVANSTGVSYPAIAPTILGGIAIPLPPLPEQQAIAGWLDERTRRIDELVAAKRRLIDLLAEQRTALITHAVTMGLNPAVPMKPSGIDWLGDVPGHWEVKRLRFSIRKIEQGWSPQCEARQIEGDTEWGVLKVGCVNGAIFDETEHKALPADLDPVPEYEVKPGDVLMSRANTRELLGSAAYVHAIRPRLHLCDKLYRIREDPRRFDARFLVLSFRALACRFQFERESDGASGSMKNIGQDTLKNCWMLLPPLPEQRAIVAHLDAACAKLDALTTTTETAIARLTEYRQALISAAVTGKIKVTPESNDAASHRSHSP